MLMIYFLFNLEFIPESPLHGKGLKDNEKSNGKHGLKKLKINSDIPQTDEKGIPLSAINPNL